MIVWKITVKKITKLHVLVEQKGVTNSFEFSFFLWHATDISLEQDISARYTVWQIKIICIICKHV